jgi:hypothetical protein
LDLTTKLSPFLPPKKMLKIADIFEEKSVLRAHFLKFFD